MRSQLWSQFARAVKQSRNEDEIQDQKDFHQKWKKWKEEQTGHRAQSLTSDLKDVLDGWIGRETLIMAMAIRMR